MDGTPKRIALVTPRAASWLWGISTARMRQRALEGRLESRTVRNISSRPSRAYLFDALCAQWGDPDPDRLGLLVRLDVLQMGPSGAVAEFQIYTARPVVLDASGELASE